MTSYNLVHVQCMFKYVATLVMGVRLYNIEFHSWFVYTLLLSLVYKTPVLEYGLNWSNMIMNEWILDETSLIYCIYSYSTIISTTNS